MGAAPAARHDDGVTDQPDHDPAPSDSRLRLILAGALVVALVASVVWLVVGLTSRGGDAEGSRQDARDAVMLRSREYVKEAWNYGRADLDDQDTLSGYRDRVLPLITTSFATDFEKTLPLVEQLIAQEGFARTTTVDHLGVESLDPDSAVVIVNGQISETQGERQLQPTPYFWKLDLDKVEGTWRVADLSGFEGAR